MNFKKLVFFNQWRNGDCFICKEYVRDIVDHFSSDVDIFYAHNNHSNIVGDLPVKFITLNDIPKMDTFMPIGLDTNTKTVYINTWVGCWIGKHMGNKDHANFYILYDMWKNIYDALDIKMKGSYNYYLPTIHWDNFDLSEPKEYLKKNDGKRLIFFSNGKQQSEQSSMGNMRNIIRKLTEEFTNIEFYATDSVDFEIPNLTVCTHESGFLNQLAYITTKAELIIGKNSGPFTYAHTKENINDLNKTFMCFSHKLKDCLLGQGEYLCNSYFNDTTDDDKAIQIIRHLITSSQYDSNFNSTRFYFT
jgi:hypothetical protein